MYDMLVKMQEGLKENGYTNRKLGKMLGVSHTTICGYFSESGTEFDFLHYVETLRLYAPNDVEFRRKHIIRMFDMLSPANERVALEVLNMYGEFGLQDELIRRMKTRKLDKTTKNLMINKKISLIYELLTKRLNGEYSHRKYFDEVENLRNSIKTSNAESQIMLGFANVYAHLNYGDYKMVSTYTEQLTDLINGVSKKTLKKSYQLRSKEMLSMSKQRGDELEESRSLCLDIINDELNPYQCMKALAYCTFAETYIRDDYNMAKSLLEQSLLTMPALTNEKLIKRRYFIETTMDFLKIVHEKELDTLNPKSDSEKAHLYAKTGREDEANYILDNMEKKNGGLSAFQKCYRGIATGEKSYFEDALSDLKKTGNFFYSFLPKMYL